MTLIWKRFNKDDCITYKADTINHEYIIEEFYPSFSLRKQRKGWKVFYRPHQGFGPTEKLQLIGRGEDNCPLGVMNLDLAKKTAEQHLFSII